MRKLIYSILTIIGILSVSCEKSETITDHAFNAQIKTNEGSQIKKVRKLKNPYSVENMRTAYAALQQEGLMKAPMNIEATHYYIRFLPKDSTELEILYNDTTLTLFSYPLDYELTEGERYIDSTLMNNKFTWLYTRVPVDYISPVSKYEKIEPLYLPITNEGVAQQAQQQRVNSAFIDSWEILEAKSIELTGNGNEYTVRLSKGVKKAPAKWRPEATIRVYDDVTNSYIPVPGVKVRGRWWFNWESGMTNANGWTKLSGEFRGKLNWSIEWSGNYWDIRDGLFWQAYYNGPNKSGTNWHLDINSKYSKAYAHVTRACWTMFLEHGLGTVSPAEALWIGMHQRQKISVFNTKGTGTNYGENWFVFSQIAIHMLKNDGSLWPSEDIYATTIHELAHTFHILKMDVNLASYAFVGKLIYESWASAVEWAVTNNEYLRLKGGSYNYIQNKQWNWALLNTDNSKIMAGDKSYSPVFIDLIDNENQKNIYALYHPDYEYPNDNVSGFTLEELSKILRKTFTIKGLKTNVKALRSDETTLSNIDKLFETYEKVK